MRSKIISFIIGGLIGFALWSVQTKAWASPAGYKEMSQVEVADPEEFMEENAVDIPKEVSDICEKYGEEYNICPEVCEAICWRESRCTANAKNGLCRGIMQVNEKVHKDRMKKLKVTDIYDLDGNIHVGFDLLSDLYSTNKNMKEALDAYNGNSNSEYSKQVLKVAKCLDMTGGD